MSFSAQTRVRIARRQAGLSQVELARLVGVHRSAVSQWELVGGATPSAENLARIAVSTNVQFEWLATGRGRMSFKSDLAGQEDPSALLNYSAHNEVEARALAALRRLDIRDVLAVVEMVEVLGRSREVKLSRVIAFSR